MAKDKNVCVRFKFMFLPRPLKRSGDWLLAHLISRCESRAQFNPSSFIELTEKLDDSKVNYHLLSEADF